MVTRGPVTVAHSSLVRELVEQAFPQDLVTPHARDENARMDEPAWYEPIFAEHLLGATIVHLRVGLGTVQLKLGCHHVDCHTDRTRGMSLSLVGIRNPVSEFRLPPRVTSASASSG